VRSERRIEALVEEERVVLDIGIPTETIVSEASAVTRAHIAANPVVFEFVVIVARAEGYTASRRRCAGVQFVAIGSVHG